MKLRRSSNVDKKFGHHRKRGRRPDLIERCVCVCARVAEVWEGVEGRRLRGESETYQLRGELAQEGKSRLDEVRGNGWKKQEKAWLGLAN